MKRWELPREAQEVLDEITREGTQYVNEEHCLYCTAGLFIYEGAHVKVCVACRPMAYHTWRLNGFPRLPRPEETDDWTNQ